MNSKPTKSNEALAAQWQETMRDLAGCCTDKETRLAETVELSRMEARLLSLIGSRNGMLPSDAAAELGLVRSRITRLVEGLTAKELINCQSGQADGRCRFLMLTDKGKRKVKKMLEVEQQFHMRLLEVIPEEKRVDLLSELKTLMTTLQGVKSQFFVSEAAVAAKGKISHADV